MKTVDLSYLQGGHKVIEIFGKYYSKDDLPKEIILNCGCIYEKSKGIGIGYINKYLCPIHTPSIDIEKIKLEKISQLKKEASSIILNRYPLWKQINFNILSDYDEYTSEAKTMMITFIKGIIDQCNAFEDTIDNLTTIEEVNDYTYTYEE